MKGKTHTIKYRYTCENCGKITDWYSSTIEEVTETYGAAELVSNIADKNRFEKQLNKFKEKSENGVYDFHFQAGAACPSCGKRQSWLPVGTTFMPPYARIALYMCGWIFIGIALIIIAKVLEDTAAIFEWLTYDGWALCIFVPPLIGLALAIRRNRINARKNEDLQSSAKVHNKPEIDWNGV